MPQAKIYNQQAEIAGEQELSAKIFAVPAKMELIHQAVVTQLARERKVLAHTKDRSEVRGGGRKPWRQKGTGRARAGSTRSPIWIGGGVTFGPLKERNFSKKINKKMKQKALFMALSDKLAEGKLIILDNLELKEAKTKLFGEVIAKLEKKVLLPKKETTGDEKAASKSKKAKTVQPKDKTRRSFLIILDKKNDDLKYAGRNLAGVEIIYLDNINIVDLLKYRNLVLTAEAVKKIEERYKKQHLTNNN